MLITKARAGYAITDDIVELWRWRRQRKDPDNPPTPPHVQCYACGSEVTPNVRHLVWECEGLDAIRSKHRPVAVTSYEDWIRPRTAAKETLGSLWSFACEASIVSHT